MNSGAEKENYVPCNCEVQEYERIPSHKLT